MFKENKYKSGVQDIDWDFFNNFNNSSVNKGSVNNVVFNETEVVTSNYCCFYHSVCSCFDALSTCQHTIDRSLLKDNLAITDYCDCRSSILDLVSSDCKDVETKNCISYKDIIEYRDNRSFVYFLLSLFALNLFIFIYFC